MGRKGYMWGIRNIRDMRDIRDVSYYTVGIRDIWGMRDIMNWNIREGCKRYNMFTTPAPFEFDFMLQCKSLWFGCDIVRCSSFLFS